MKSLMNRSELLLHVTIASQCRSLTNTPAGTPGPGRVCGSLRAFTAACVVPHGQQRSFLPIFRLSLASKSVSDAKSVNPMVKQPVFLRSMSAPSDLEMIANQDVEFTHAPQRYSSPSQERVISRAHELTLLYVLEHLQKAPPPFEPPQQLLHPAAVFGHRGQSRQTNVQRPAGAALRLYRNHSRSGCT